MLDARAALAREENSGDEQLEQKLEDLIQQLQRGRYIDPDGIVTLKGRAACEVCSCLFSPLLSLLVLSLPFSSLSFLS
jgi:hypothetical protein